MPITTNPDDEGTITEFSDPSNPDVVAATIIDGENARRGLACFNEETVNLMDFNCEQRGSVHFFYVLPFSKNKAMIETTWLSKEDLSLKDYEAQIKNYINHLGIKNYKITFKEEGAIPLFYPIYKKEKNKINIGTAGGMTRLSTGYTFLNIQEHSKYIRKNIENIENQKKTKKGNIIKYSKAYNPTAANFSITG